MLKHCFAVKNFFECMSLNNIHTRKKKNLIAIQLSYIHAILFGSLNGGLVFHRRPRFDEIKTLNDYQVVPELARICLYFLPCQCSWPQGAVKMQHDTRCPIFFSPCTLDYCSSKTCSKISALFEIHQNSSKVNFYIQFFSKAEVF